MGILEEMNAKLDRLLAAQAAASAPAAAQVATPAAAQVAADPFAGLGGSAIGSAASPPANVTAEMITALIEPHLENTAIKEQLGVAMRELGISELPSTPPEKYGALYAAFHAVITRNAGGGTATPSII